jgi:hypothetical protein
MEPIPPIARRETALRGVQSVQRPRLLTPAEREEARRERERKREERAAQERPERADHQA